MSLATHGTGLASFQQSAGEFLDLSNELAAIIKKDNTAFMMRAPMGDTAFETAHAWMEDSLNANSSISNANANGVLDTSATTLVLASGEGVKFRVGTIFRDIAAGQSEVMQVTAISTDTLTIVRAYGGTTAATHGTGSTAFSILIISNPTQENQDAPADESKVRTKVTNYTQIYTKGVQISYTMRAVNQAGVPDEYSFQIARRLQEIERELDNNLINGIKSASAGSDSVYRTSGGIVQFASQAGGNTNTTAETLQPSVLSVMAKQMYDVGGYPNFVLVAGALKRSISAFDQAYRRSSFDTTTAGYVVDKFLTDLGYMVDVIVDPWTPVDAAVMGDMQKIKVMPLQNDSMRAEDLARTGRTWKAQVTGQYTVEFRNGKQAFAYHNNLS